MPPVLSSYVNGVRGADVALTWRGVRPPYPLRRTYATGASPPLGLAGGRSRSLDHARKNERTRSCGTKLRTLCGTSARSCTTRGMTSST